MLNRSINKWLRTLRETIHKESKNDGMAFMNSKKETIDFLAKLYVIKENARDRVINLDFRMIDFF